jgi:HEPN domain-containing protein
MSSKARLLCGMTRNQWKRKCDEHADAARTLFLQGQFSVAYYLSGLAVECAIKAKIARKFKSGTWPERAFVDDIYRNGHNLKKLLDYADLSASLDAEIKRWI